MSRARIARRGEQGAGPRPVARRTVTARGQHGFSAVELMVTVAVIGIMTIPAGIYFITYLQGQQLRSAAQQVATLLNEARQLAITGSTPYRVEVDTSQNRLRFVKVSNSTAWKGPGTDADGYTKLENDSKITAVSLTPPSYITFNGLGTATSGNITVQAVQGNASMKVVVNSTGRVRQCVTGTSGC